MNEGTLPTSSVFPLHSSHPLREFKLEFTFIPRSRASTIPASLRSEHELWILQARTLLALRPAAQGLRRNRKGCRQRIRRNHSGGNTARRPGGADGGDHSRPSLYRAGIVLLRLHRALSRAGRDEHHADDPDDCPRDLHRLRHLPASLSRTGKRRADAATPNLPCPAGRVNRAGDDHANPAFCQISLVFKTMLDAPSVSDDITSHEIELDTFAGSRRCGIRSFRLRKDR